MAKPFEIDLKQPGRLIYKEGNYEYVFPCFEQDGEIVVVDVPTRARLFLFFNWAPIPRNFSEKDIAKIRSNLIEYFRRVEKNARFFDTKSREEQSFAFYPELFEQRSVAIELLDGEGFAWMTDYSSVDVLHDLYGLEVCGIHDESKAQAISHVMQKEFPQWHYHNFCFKDYGREPGWKFSISMFSKGCGGGRCMDAE
ncbi:MAG TPA: hypothetical protein VGN23_07310 [Verrucomicrobiae bacterium]|jgi:hypothetical protein